MWLFSLCTLGTIKRLKEEKHVPSLTQFSAGVLSALKFPAVICIVLHLQSAYEPLGVHVRRGYASREGGDGEREGGGES